MAEATHRPVLVEEVVSLLRDSDTVFDLTVGAGGHAAALLDAGVARVIGVDRDPDALAEAGGRLSAYGDRFRAERAVFSDVGDVAARAGVGSVDGVLYDLGVSSRHLDDPERGFSYRAEGPLDMRMGPDGPTAADIVNTWSERDLEAILRGYGEERFAGRIARAIVRRRPIATTQELVAVVAAAVPPSRRAHPARRTFQALRIAVNAELEELAASLPRAVELLAPHGRLVAIAYHSLEDRIVKRFVASRSDLTALTKKPVRPSAEEVASNPRARSARLRAAERNVGAAGGFGGVDRPGGRSTRARTASEPPEAK